MADEDDSGTSFSEDDIQILLSHAPENRPKGGFLTADPDPTDKDCSGMAVRLDVAVLAVRLTCWKVVTRIYPKKRRTLLGAAEQRIEQWIAKWGTKTIGRALVGEAAKQLAKDIAGWLLDIINIFEAAKNAREVEQLIRGQCHVVRRQLLSQALTKSHRPHRKVVSTRHGKR